MNGLVSDREILEAENLNKVLAHLKTRIDQTITKATILPLHDLLLGTINQRIAGRFRARGEYVRIGSHFPPAPEHVEAMLQALLDQYAQDHQLYFLDHHRPFSFRI